MKSHALNIIYFVLRRHLSWRISRSLYLKSKADTPNVATLNGEEFLQGQLLARFGAVRDPLVVFDVGANIGDWTCSLLHQACNLNLEGGLELHAFEPIPSSFAVFKERVSKHKLRGCLRLVSKALSNEDVTAEMYISGDTAGTNSLHPDAMNQNQRRLKVEKTTVSEYCYNNNIAIIHFIKCDTEGHDMEVMFGARKLFDEQRIMACQFEYNHRWVYSRHFLKDVFDLFKNTAYKIGKITPRGIELYFDWHPELERYFEGNYIILHTHALNWFTTITGRFDVHNTYRAQAIHLAGSHSDSLNGND